MHLEFLFKQKTRRMRAAFPSCDFLAAVVLDIVQERAGKPHARNGPKLLFPQEDMGHFELGPLVFVGPLVLPKWTIGCWT